MTLTRFRIMNFRNCRDVSLEIRKMHALVGTNNAAKCYVLQVFHFMSNPSSRIVNDRNAAGFSVDQGSGKKRSMLE
jgi:AAA15 family ATPase/GTPase